MNNLTNKILTLVVSSVFLAACNGGGSGGSYQSKPNNFPQIDCLAAAVYSVTPPNIKGSLVASPVKDSPYGTDTYVLFNNSGNGYLGAGIDQSGLLEDGSLWLWNFGASTLNTTPSTPFPEGVCTMLNVDNDGSIYKGGVMFWTNCQAPVENGIMNFSADYQVYESTGTLVSTGSLSFSCSTESPNITNQLLLRNKMDLKSLLKEVK